MLDGELCARVRASPPLGCRSRPSDQVRHQGGGERLPCLYPRGSVPSGPAKGWHFLRARGVGRGVEVEGMAGVSATWQPRAAG